MPIVLLNRADEEYLQKCAVETKFSFGILIGQQAEPQKYIIVHCAKNGEEDVDFNLDLNSPTDSVENIVGPQSIDDIDTQALTNQWVSAGKMIPGSFEVLGLFIAGTSEELVQEQTFKTAKKLLYDLHHLLTTGSVLSEALKHDKDAEYIFLAYSSKSDTIICKTYTNNGNGGSYSSMDMRIVEKPFEWYTFECNYELEDVFPISETSKKVNIEEQFQRAIEATKRTLDVCEIFIQNEYVDDNTILDDFIRKRHRQKGRHDEHFKATIFLPVKCQIGKGQSIKVREYNGTIRFTGVISSRIWCNSKNLLGDIKRYIRNDILRSLVARIQVYCDGLTEPNITGDALFISEPPRRVYFNVPGDDTQNPIQFSEYIFRGEAPTVAVAQAKQILDLDIKSEHIEMDLEGLPDDSNLEELSSDSTSSSLPSIGGRDLTRSMYMLGISVALLVLFLSVLLHFLTKD